MADDRGLPVWVVLSGLVVDSPGGGKEHVGGVTGSHALNFRTKRQALESQWACKPGAGPALK